MNAVLIAVLIMLILSLLRIHVVIALVSGAIVGGLIAGFTVDETLSFFGAGLGSNASVALSYAMLGAFAVAISFTGLPNLIVSKVVSLVGREGDSQKRKLSKAFLLLVILLVSISSQNVIPIHIAFIPILIPPLIKVFNALFIDRRILAVIMTFGLKAPYILLPFGFGLMFHEIIERNMNESGMTIELAMIPKALALPVLGMVIGLVIAIFFSYGKEREYINKPLGEENQEKDNFTYSIPSVVLGLSSVVIVLILQYLTKSMIFSAFIGLVILYLYFAYMHYKGNFQLSETETLMTNGMKMMAFIGFVMIAAGGFAEVIRETGHIDFLVEASANIIGDNKALAAILMLLVGLLITMGIGSSFSTIPIIAVIFVPLAEAIGFSTMATIALIGTAGALGDAGSPASDSTLGPTAGLNVDGQHHHIWDTCVPTFIHLNIPLLIFGWVAAILL
ncbi:putative histidine transporter YuiF (NhaC family) [Evansella vedderi]|uniref:Histidine transporter YuiF (NhaC family) n=1 Tax=Evansella vedderi TaxID=38282 RepID=A0ABU0A2D4_9BACI|nr:Na+/H+ antiporter NhaC family protein [Evansella vedderi]MDQ0257659.1 putative histidine transporter YuiF (NhaC family) [Evansella vedderi]